ncbi:DUF6489 family protein [Pontixanthobacter aquaemixtae]|uniref:Uncharacterized protein n=1 Tax=Pontixanthobacter aquaemixtae TaxID=1958940 RepID=A0A844ZTX9_9SPHN|nr:DUF6489 family protein [Pontixanthobacter aquaemixtae]MXO91413.1 hypothetical protein [Pontixanthobacter aquaemixtae]
MKVNIEIDCSPEEARTFLGLPDVTKANDIYVDTVSKAMKGVSDPEQIQQFAKQLAPMGQIGFKLFQNFVEGASSAAASKPKSSKKD